VRSLVTAARGPLSVTTELAGFESVPFGGGSGTSGSIGPLTVGTTLRGSGGHSDPAVIEISPVQSRVLSGGGGSSLGLVGVGIPAAAADAAAAATVGGVVERTGRADSFAERADSPTNRTHTIGQDLSHTEMPNLTTTKKPDLTVVLTVTEVFTLRSPTRRPRAHHKIVSHQSVIATFVFVVIKYFGEAVLRPLACCGQGQVPPACAAEPGGVGGHRPPNDGVGGTMHSGPPPTLTPVDRNKTYCFHELVLNLPAPLDIQ